MSPSDAKPTPVPFEAARLGPLTLRNRVIKAATFEGVMPRGQVTPELIDFHVRVARGGAALSTVAYCAVSKGGRVSRDTMVMTPNMVGDLTRLTAAVQAEGAKISAQLGHAGLVAQAHNRRNPSLAPSTRFSAPATGVIRAATREDLDQVVSDFTAATTVAIEAGFDAVEVHIGHNYLLSSFLSPNLNHRRDEFGGSIENRARFPRRVLEAVRKVADGRIAVIAKLNMADGVERGLWLSESLQFAKLFESDGTLDAIQLTGGSSLLNGMYYFRGDVPLREFAEAQGPLIGLGVRAYGRRIFPKLPFEEAFFLPFARQFRRELDIPLILLGGINELSTINSAVADEGFEFVAMARALLREPDLVNRFERNHQSAGICVHCNKCMPTIYTGTRCVLVDSHPSIAPAR
ncbi:MAG: NADH:flavin oxidoreductase [Microthrixaceae bacterium]|jgi:2,4-dienoyl-CoA reductase-like NADH-dependent reductase (Old Yellow Enzyme family)|nr:NADH:flavin oxidoreductase [Microthrixaceae bacterium]